MFQHPQASSQSILSLLQAHICGQSRKSYERSPCLAWMYTHKSYINEWNNQHRASCICVATKLNATRATCIYISIFRTDVSITPASCYVCYMREHCIIPPDAQLLLLLTLTSLVALLWSCQSLNHSLESYVSSESGMVGCLLTLTLR